MKISFQLFVLLLWSMTVLSEVRTFGEGAVTLSGSFQQGTLLEGKLKDADALLLNGRTVRVTNDGHFVIGFGRDANLVNSLTLLKNGEPVSDIKVTLAKRDYKVQKVNGVPQKTVNPPKERLERIRQETAMVKKARRTDSGLLHFLSKFEAPIDATITGVYGSQRFYNGVPKRPHFGVDYAGPMGAPVYAPADAVVTLTHSDMYYSGGTLIVDHGFGVSSTFIHLSEILVEEGQHIKQGDLIAKVGSGGRSTGPHLDWRVNWYQERVDPLLVLEKHQ